MTDLRALLANATPRPWHIVGLPWNEGAPYLCSAEDPHAGTFIADFCDYGQDDPESPRSETDAALIVALVNQADDLLTVVEAARRYAKFELRACGDPACDSAECELIAALARLDTHNQQDAA